MRSLLVSSARGLALGSSAPPPDVERSGAGRGARRCGVSRWRGQAPLSRSRAGKENASWGILERSFRRRRTGGGLRRLPRGLGVVGRKSTGSGGESAFTEDYKGSLGVAHSTWMVNNSLPPHPPLSPRHSTAGGRELRLESPPPCSFYLAIEHPQTKSRRSDRLKSGLDRGEEEGNDNNQHQCSKYQIIFRT